MSAPGPSVASQVKVRRLYEVHCGICNENPFDEFYDTRREADEARAEHIAAHAGDPAEPAGAWGDGRMHREF